jgi:hypothetical protein
LAGFTDSLKNVLNKVTKPIKSAGTSLKEATIKVGKSANSALKSAAKGLCKVAQNPAVQQGNQMATAVPDPTTQGIAQGVAMIGSFCNAAYPPGTTAEQIAAIEAADPALQAALLAQLQPKKDWTPWIIGGAVGTAALVGGALILKK